MSGSLSTMTLKEVQIFISTSSWGLQLLIWQLLRAAAFGGHMPTQISSSHSVQCAGAWSKMTGLRHRLFSSCNMSKGPSAQHSLHVFTKENRGKHHIICGCSSADAPFAHYNLWAVLWNDWEGWGQSALLSSGIWRQRKTCHECAVNTA